MIPGLPLIMVEGAPRPRDLADYTGCMATCADAMSDGTPVLTLVFAGSGRRRCWHSGYFLPDGSPAEPVQHADWSGPVFVPPVWPASAVWEDCHTRTALRLRGVPTCAKHGGS